MRLLRLVILLSLIGCRVNATSYTTTFSGANENPISEGGNWINGQATGKSWSDCAVLSHIAYGAQTTENPNGNPFNDSTAVLSGAWGPNQAASGTVSFDRSGALNNQFLEIELRLNSSITTSNCTGYEIDFSANIAPTRHWYAVIVRWNGPFNNFTQIAETNTVAQNSLFDLHTGDILSATNSNGTIKVYINGTNVLTGTDTTYTGGSPGIGFDLAGNHSFGSAYGFTAFNASDSSVAGGGTLNIGPGTLRIGPGTFRVGQGVGSSQQQVQQPAGGGTNSVDWVAIETNGWVADVHILGLTNGGVYNYGLGPTNSFSGIEKLSLTVNSPGYDDTGASNGLARTVVGTLRLRQPFPNQTLASELTNATGVTLRIGLSDYINANDTITGVSIGSGLYAQQGTNYATNFTAGASITNPSNLSAPRVLAMWSQPGHFLVGSNYNLSLVAFHYSAQQARPVRAVKFWAVDGNGNRSPTNTVLNPTIDATQNDALSNVVEYVTTIDGSGFSQRATISNYAKVFPWYGPALDFSDGANLPSSPDYAPLICYCNKLNTWPIVLALVDTNASGTPKAVTDWVSATNGTAVPFATLADALNGAGATNNAVNGTNTLENCFILLTNGAYAVWGGPNIISRNASRPWTTFMARPDVNWSNVFLNSKNNSQTGDKSLRMRFFHLVFAATGAANTIDAGYGDVLIEQSQAWTNLNAVALVSSTTNCWLKQSTVLAMRGFPNPQNAQANSWLKVRGCTFLQFDGPNLHTTSIDPNLFIGNNLIPYTNDSYTLGNDVTTTADPVIWAYNKFMRADASSAYACKLGIGTNINIGAAFVQNLIECSKGGGSIPLDVMFSARANEWCTNVLIWQNTVVATYHAPFNLGGFTTVSSDHYMEANNIFALRQVIMDIHDSNAAATNRWGQLWTVGGFNDATQIGNEDPATQELGFNGVSSWCGGDVETFLFVRNNSAFETNITFFGTGGGDYHLTAASPLNNPVIVGRALLPYDIEGVYRGATNQPPGAYLAFK